MRPVFNDCPGSSHTCAVQGADDAGREPDDAVRGTQRVIAPPPSCSVDDSCRLGSSSSVTFMQTRTSPRRLESFSSMSSACADCVRPLAWAAASMRFLMAAETRSPKDGPRPGGASCRSGERAARLGRLLPGESAKTAIQKGPGRLGECDRDHGFVDFLPSTTGIHRSVDAHRTTHRHARATRRKPSSS